MDAGASQPSLGQPLAPMISHAAGAVPSAYGPVPGLDPPSRPRFMFPNARTNIPRVQEKTTGEVLVMNAVQSITDVHFFTETEALFAALMAEHPTSFPAPDSPGIALLLRTLRDDLQTRRLEVIYRYILTDTKTAPIYVPAVRTGIVEGASVRVLEVVYNRAPKFWSLPSGEQPILRLAIWGTLHFKMIAYGEIAREGVIDSLQRLNELLHQLPTPPERVCRGLRTGIGEILRANVRDCTSARYVQGPCGDLFRSDRCEWFAAERSYGDSSCERCLGAKKTLIQKARRHEKAAKDPSIRLAREMPDSHAPLDTLTPDELKNRLKMAMSLIRKLRADNKRKAVREAEKLVKG